MNEVLPHSSDLEPLKKDLYSLRFLVERDCGSREKLVYTSFFANQAGLEYYIYLVGCCKLSCAFVRALIVRDLSTLKFSEQA